MATKLMDKAKKEKADEFYTQLSDIENEMRYKSYACSCNLACTRLAKQ